MISGRLTHLIIFTNNLVMFQFSILRSFISAFLILLICGLQSVHAQVDKIEIRSIGTINHLLNGGGTWSARGIRLEDLDDLTVVVEELEEYRKRIGDEQFYNGILRAAHNEQDAAVILWTVSSLPGKDGDVNKRVRASIKWFIESAIIDGTKEVTIPHKTDNQVIAIKTTLSAMLNKVN